MRSEEIRTVQEFPMMLNFKGSGAINVNEFVSETVGGKDVKYKVIKIHSVEVKNGTTQVVVMVRELPNTKKD